jgi:hypothetical protein
MQATRSVTAIIAEILAVGLLRIRASAWNGNPDRCAIEADHLHNLPALLTQTQLDLLEYYWNVERISFVKQSSGENLECFEPLWKELSQYVGAPKDGLAAAST